MKARGQTSFGIYTFNSLQAIDNRDMYARLGVETSAPIEGGLVLDGRLMKYLRMHVEGIEAAASSVRMIGVDRDSRNGHIFVRVGILIQVR